MFGHTSSFVNVPWLLLVASWVLMSTSESKTVVMMPSPALSHTRYHCLVARALSQLGHEVFVTIPSFISDKGYLNTTEFKTIPYETLPNIEERASLFFIGSYLKGQQNNVFDRLQYIRDIYTPLLQNETFLHTIKDKKPDLIVIDSLSSMYSMTIIPYRLGIPFAFLGTGYNALKARIPFSPGETPISILPYSNTMTFTERVKTFILYVVIMLTNPIAPQDIVSKFAPEMPYVSFDALIAKAEVWLVETDHIFDYPRPTVPNVKLIGGMAAQPAQPLPSHFRSFMDVAKDGVVVVSFGNYVLELPKAITDKLFQVFNRLAPMRVVFRSNLSSPEPDRILTSQWLPQNDLLGHPNTKVIVSHCGNNGQYEALYHAVPLFAMPLFADQPYNAERARLKGFAEVLDLKTSTSQEMVEAIQKVARDPSYKRAVSRRSRLFRQQFGVPANRAAFWLDHVMEFGGDYMRSAGLDMPLWQFLMVDVIVFVAVVLLCAAGLVSLCLCVTCRCLCRKKVKVD